jgi:DNA-binding CsgD family transcriptional regulator
MRKEQSPQNSRSSRRVQEQGVELSKREIDCLQVAAEGKTARETSEQLALATRTANFHINNAMNKLGASNKTHAVVLAMRMGLLE